MVPTSVYQKIIPLNSNIVLELVGTFFWSWKKKRPDLVRESDPEPLTP